MTDLALRKLRVVLEMPTPVGVDANEIALLKAQIAAADRVLTTQVRVDDNRLKARQISTIPKLLALIAAEKDSRVIEGGPL